MSEKPVTIKIDETEKPAVTKTEKVKVKKPKVVKAEKAKAEKPKFVKSEIVKCEEEPTLLDYARLINSELKVINAYEIPTEVIFLDKGTRSDQQICQVKGDFNSIEATLNYLMYEFKISNTGYVINEYDKIIFPRHDYHSELKIFLKDLSPLPFLSGLKDLQVSLENSS
jgi:hypothetical protein